MSPWRMDAFEESGVLSDHPNRWCASGGPPLVTPRVMTSSLRSIGADGLAGLAD